MEFTQLPTDNLYIFLTVSGLVIIFFSFNYFIKSIHKIKDKIFDSECAITDLEIESEMFDRHLSIRKNILLLKEEAYEKKFNIKFNRKRDSENNDLKFILPEHLTNDEIGSYIKDYEDIADCITKLENENGNVRKTAKRLLAENDLTSKMHKQLKNEIFGLIFLTIIGVNMTLWGFCSWYFKNQQYQDGIIKAQFEQTINNKK